MEKDKISLPGQSLLRSYQLSFDEEKRRFHRLLLALPVEYTAFHPESGEKFQGEGFLKDFSLSGLFFHSSEPVCLQPGHRLTLTISTPLPRLNFSDLNHIQARGEVVRLEEPSPGNGYHGVAVTFHEFPTFADLTN